MSVVRTVFDASAVAFERDDDLNAQYLVLAEHADGSGRRLEIQRALDSDEQDVALGHDTYCFVTDDQVTHYGGAVAWTLEGPVLDLDLTVEASRAIGAPGFRITVPAAERATVERALRTLLA